VLASWITLVKFVFKVITARILGYRLIWTLHNLLPHEREYPLIDQMAGFILAHFANSIIALCEEGRSQLIQKYHRSNNVITGYLGHYIGIYPDRISRSEARSKLNLSEDLLVFIFFGSIRMYKGIEELIASFHKLPDENIRLLVCGQPIDDEYKSKIQSLGESDHRIITRLCWIPDDQLQYYFKAADIAILPFLNVLTSSSIINAYSFGLPVITPAIGCSPEIVDQKTGFLYDPQNPYGLLEGMRICIDKKECLPEMGMNAFQHVQQFSWDRLAEVTCQAYGIK
jgi:glycosyltransferase involved in cell wall biosynthesis